MTTRGSGVADPRVTNRGVRAVTLINKPYREESMVAIVGADDAKVEYIEGGIDWLTATLPSSSPTGELWVEHCLSVIDQIAERGYEVKARTLQGYYGASAGNCFVGSREDGHIIQLTGSLANDYFSSVYRTDLHVSRLDVQTTAKFDVMPTTIAMKGYHNAALNNKTLPESRRRKLVIIRGSDGGDTLYIGSASSLQRGRIYNKAVQSEIPQYARCWRYEVVFRNELGTQLAARVPYPIGTRAKWAAQICLDWFEHRGVPDCGFNSGLDVILPLTSPIPSDVERKLRWIEKQVAPTVRYLIEKGYRDTILASLNLLDSQSTNS
jgi:DNA relaxase NicK